jgi:hypothetical protein
MQPFLLTTALAALETFAAASAPAGEAAARKPNVVILLADDKYYTAPLDD